LTRPSAWAVAGIVAVAVATVAASVAVAPGVPGVLGAALGLVMLAIAAIDARRFIIPDELTAVGLALALVNAGLDAWPDPWSAILVSLGIAVLRGVVLAAAFLALRALYYRVRRREGIGLGDVKLAGVAGAWLQWATIPVAIEIAALAALALYTLRQVAGGHVMTATARLPFGLFLAPAIWLGWVLEATLLGR
jgi:leader peptidase (prepilin peptidase)/N-methyltransferase